MAGVMKMMFMVVVLMVVLVEGRKSSVHAAVELCKMNEDGLNACKPAVNKENPVDPTPDCCTALSGADLGCLCSYKTSPLLPALGIDPGLAMGLASKCHLTPPTNC